MGFGWLTSGPDWTVIKIVLEFTIREKVEHVRIN
jgi:hypothetical protein